MEEHHIKGVINGWKRFVKLWIVVDYELHQQFNGDRNLVQQRCIDIVNTLNAVRLRAIHFLLSMTFWTIAYGWF